AQAIVVVIVVLIIILAIAFMLIMNHKQLREIIELDDLITKIDKMNLEADIVKLNKMELAGESLITLTTWRESYQQATTKKIPQVQALLDQAAEQNAHYLLFKARKNIKQAQGIMRPTYDDAKNTQEVFTELLESHRENQMQYDELNKNYLELRKKVLADSFEYGVALDRIEDELAAIEQDFSEAKSLTAQGDQVEAKRVLSKIKAALDLVETVLPKVRDARRQLDQVFRAQLGELSDTYKKMMSSKYYITQIDVLGEIKKIRGQVNEASRTLADLKIAELDKQISEIKSAIADLYEVLTREYK
ncbi:septation ring formation regulator EzrA, partial [Lactobacillus sp. XV13L]|nr:septation ring formation regulator EzrA [Lactobacillus sp. XV13L]